VTAAPEPEEQLVAYARRLEREDPCAVEVGPEPPDPTAAVAHGIVGALVGVEAGRLSDARSRASRAVGRARRAGVGARWVGRAVAVSAWVLSATDHRSAVALARRAGSESDDPWTRTLGALVLARASLARGDPPAALRHLDGATVGLPWADALVRALGMRSRLAAHDLAGARRLLGEGADDAPPWSRALLLAASPPVWLATGEGDAGHARLGEALTWTGASPAPVVAFLHQGRGDFERWAGRLDAATHSYQEASARLEALTHPARGEVRGQLCLLHLLAGRLDEAEAELAVFEAEAPPGVGAVLGAAIAAAAGDRDRWARHHEHARAWLVRTGTADPALCFRLAREAWSAGLDRDDRSRAFRAGAAALSEWRALGRDRERIDELRKLRALASLGVPIPAGPFDLLEVLGAGGAGTVWRGRHHVHGIEVAVKVLRREVTGDDTLRIGFHQEVRVVAGLEHPGIVRILGHGELDETAAMAGEPHHHGAPWFAMELVTGGTAQDVVGRLRWSACRGILMGVLDALAHAHARGVHHLDIKPANVLLEADPQRPGAFRPRLTDFGLSGLAEGGRATGTPQYMAPEQFRARDLGPWTDLYAVGCLATALVTGFPPFRRTDVEALRQAHLTAEPPELLPVVQLPRGFEEWVLRLLEKLPQDRFETAADAAWALYRLADPLTDDPPQNASAVHQNTTPLSFSLPAWDAQPDENEADDAPLRLPSELPPMPVSWRPPAVDPLPGLQALELFALKRIPLVGRQRERDLLWATLADVHRRRRPRLVSLEGRSGSGRSSLAAWLSETARERGVAHTARLPCRGSRVELGTFVADLLRLDEGHRAVDELSAPDRAIVERWRASGAEPDDTDSDPGLDERETRGQRAVQEDDVRLAAALASASARRRPLVLVLDGTPTASVDAVALARRLLLGESAVLLVVSVHPGQDVQADRRYEELLDLPPTMAVTLDALRPSEVRDLVRNLLPVDPVLADHIVDRSAADVDLAVAHLRDLVRRDALREDGGALVLRDGQELGNGANLLRTWIDRLEAVLDVSPRPLRDVLATLGLVHRGFTADEWKAVADAHGLPAPSRHLRALRSRQLLASTSTSRGLAFTHRSLPDHLLEEAEADGRLGGLARVALERLAFDHPAYLGLALLEASEPAAALEPLAQGLALARDRGDADLGRRVALACEAALGMVGAAETDPRWLPVLLGRAHLATRAQDHDVAHALALRAADLAVATRRAADEFDAVLLLATLAVERGEAARADELLKRALAAARRLDDPRRVARVRSRAAEAAFGRGDLDGALRHYRRGLDSLAALPWDDVRAELSVGLGRLQAARGEVEQAEATLSEALSRLSVSGDARRIAQALGALGRLALLRGRTRDAALRFSEALSRMPDGDRCGRAELLLDQCTVLLASGQWDPMRGLLEQVLAESGVLPVETRVWALALQLSAAATDPGSTFDAAFDEMQRVLRTAVLATVEIARVLETAAVRATLPARQRRCWSLAESQWRTVGEREAARRAREQARSVRG
jgi:serine/threonine protein kinase/tetratricopeptide (TPR) repeat protein